MPQDTIGLIDLCCLLSTEVLLLRAAIHCLVRVQLPLQELVALFQCGRIQVKSGLVAAQQRQGGVAPAGVSVCLAGYLLGRVQGTCNAGSGCCGCANLLAHDIKVCQRRVTGLYSVASLAHQPSSVVSVVAAPTSCLLLLKRDWRLSGRLLLLRMGTARTVVGPQAV